MKIDDAGAIAPRGFRTISSDKGEDVIVPIGNTGVQINPREIGKSCPVYLPAGAPSVERLSRMLEEKGLTTKTLPSPIRGSKINAEDRSGKPMTTSHAGLQCDARCGSGS